MHLALHMFQSTSASCQHQSEHGSDYLSLKARLWWLLNGKGNQRGAAPAA